ncbi:UNVERIFIED_CONTAM: hypothetical protein Scaly_2579500 [Sesamum calycinum]|uniref:DDE Tnp4 domain-containing protein n=1 Tax=Sesamum calycinum TaxID=2727403 RepID=A0AAW2JEB0_9LAMI
MRYNILAVKTMSTPDGYFSNTPTQSFTSPSSSKPNKARVSELHSKKCETMDKLNESLQGKIDRTGQKATESIERCVDELTKFKDLSDCVFTTALERFHSHSTRTIFLRLDDENKLRWLYSLGKGLLPHGQTSRVSSIEEVALFMQTVGMHKRQRDNTHSRVVSNIDFYPYFKDCVGAMDGTLVPAWVPQIDQNRYRSRKGRLAQNVLAICDFDMNFTYVYAGWEGSAADARVLNHAVSQDPKFRFLQLVSKYYLVDVGFTNYQCFLAPYRGTRYHLAEYRGNDRRYHTPQDLFNHAHSRLRNVIERCFGTKEAVSHIAMGDAELPSSAPSGFSYRLLYTSQLHPGHPTVTEIEAQRTLRDNIAMQMWASYNPTYLERSGFPQEDHWTLSVEQRLMWMIVDDNTRDSMRDDHRAEAHMAHWARGLRRHFGYHYTREQLYPLARRYYQYPEPHYPSMLEIWGPLDCPLFQWRAE